MIAKKLNNVKKNKINIYYKFTIYWDYANVKKIKII